MLDTWSGSEALYMQQIILANYNVTYNLDTIISRIVQLVRFWPDQLQKELMWLVLHAHACSVDHSKPAAHSFFP
jgi:hypothetical protein